MRLPTTGPTATPLARLTTLGVGGSADVVAPSTLSDLTELLARLWREGRAWRALGRGSNVIVADEGVPETVVHTRLLRDLRFEAGGGVVVGAGVATSLLLSETRQRGLGGLECLVGYPATIGGAARMNAGGKWGTISSRVRCVRIVSTDGTVRELSAAECAFGYRSSVLGAGVVAEVVLDLPEVDAAEYREAVDAIYREKAATQPLAERSAGCIFKNPDGESAGRLVDRSDMKGVAIGGAAVSAIHGNFIVNRGGASASDVLRLIDHVRESVTREQGVDLELEVEVWKAGRVPAGV